MGTQAQQASPPHLDERQVVGRIVVDAQRGAGSSPAGTVAHPVAEAARLRRRIRRAMAFTCALILGRDLGGQRARVQRAERHPHERERDSIYDESMQITVDEDGPDQMLATQSFVLP